MVGKVAWDSCNRSDKDTCALLWIRAGKSTKECYCCHKWNREMFLVCITDATAGCFYSFALWVFLAPADGTVKRSSRCCGQPRDWLVTVSLSLEDPVLWWDQVGKSACTEDVPPPRFVTKQNGYDTHLLVHAHTLFLVVGGVQFGWTGRGWGSVHIGMVACQGGWHEVRSWSFCPLHTGTLPLQALIPGIGRWLYALVSDDACVICVLAVRVWY